MQVHFNYVLIYVEVERDWYNVNYLAKYEVEFIELQQIGKRRLQAKPNSFESCYHHGDRILMVFSSFFIPAGKYFAFQFHRIA